MFSVLQAGLYSLSKAFRTLTFFPCAPIADRIHRRPVYHATGAEMFNKVWYDVGRCMNEAVDIVVYNKGVINDNKQESESSYKSV